jgi:hypothetical protein
VTGRQTCPAKDVSARELPHAGEELGEPAAEEGHADDDVGVGDAVDSDVVEAEDERRAGEREETQGRGVADGGGTRGGGETAAVVVDFAFLDIAHFRVRQEGRLWMVMGEDKERWIWWRVRAWFKRQQLM